MAACSIDAGLVEQSLPDIFPDGMRPIKFDRIGFLNFDNAEAADAFDPQHMARDYLIYGSEWISAVLGHSYRHVLKRSGAPTLLEIDLPLRMSSFATRKELATKMLREWARLACNQADWSAPIDFTFTLRTNIPAEWLVGHLHPRELVDPLEHYSTYRIPNPECAHCRAS